MTIARPLSTTRRREMTNASLVLVTMALVISGTLGLSSQQIHPRISINGNYCYAPHLRAKIASSVAKGERRAKERQAPSRQVCSNCSRPPVLCLCKVLPDLLMEPSTKILILQHPNEFRKPNLSTVPLLRLVLKNVEVRVGYSFDAQDLGTVVEAMNLGQKPLLLYPGPDAITLDGASSIHRGAGDSTSPEKLSARTSSKGNGNLLILIDGTWAEAKRMVRQSPSLIEHCQQVQFTVDTSSIYSAVRREPKGYCLPTLEACAKALLQLEPVTARDAVQQLQNVLQYHVSAHVRNAEILEQPRNVGVAVQRLYEKNKRRREIERTMFDSANSNKTSTSTVTLELEDGAILRRLTASDAPVVNSWWEYQSPKSLAMVSRRIQMDGGVACLGIHLSGRLVACILRYEGGALGMLYVETMYRRRGYASALLREATRALKERNEERVAFILDGNKASEALFAKLRWQRADVHIKKQSGKRRAKRKWVERD